jgi:hypothetical protein
MIKKSSILCSVYIKGRNGLGLEPDLLKIFIKKQGIKSLKLWRAKFGTRLGESIKLKRSTWTGMAVSLKFPKTLKSRLNVHFKS